MNKKLLREYVRSVLWEKTQAPQSAQLGSYAFPEKRPKKDLPKEPDTEYETHLFDALKYHINDNKHLSPSDAEKIKKFLQNNWYTDVFTPPHQNTVYRGMSLSTQELQSYLGGDIPTTKGEKHIKHTFKPKSGGGSSWTTSLDIAQEFSELYTSDEKPWSIIISASTNDNPNSFASCKPGSQGLGIYYLDNITDNTEFESENEVIGLNNITTNHISWSAPDHLTHHTSSATDEAW